jgi:hypothetical protein
MYDQTVFPPALLSEMHLRSQGIPRVINAMSDNLLLTAFALESHIASIEMLDEVCADMRLEWPGRRLRVRGSMSDETFRPATQFGRGD